MGAQRTKACTKCGQFKPFSEFYAHKTNANGVFGPCRACCIARVVKRQRERWWTDEAWRQEKSAARKELHKKQKAAKEKAKAAEKKLFDLLGL